MYEKLNKYIPLDPSFQQFPNQICSGCVQKLEIVSDFYETCLKTDGILKNILNPPREIESTTSILRMETENEIISYTLPKGLKIKKLEKEAPVVNKSSLSQSQVLNSPQPCYIFIPNLRDYEDKDNFSIIQQLEMPVSPGDGTDTNTTTLVKVKRSNVTDNRYNHTCKICGNSYRYPHLLNTHIKRHLEDKNYCCNICGKRFVIPFELKRHQRVHNGQKPYKCKHCDRDYADFSSKTKHERTHTGIRPYKCPYKLCNKSFSYSHVLKNHLLTHTGERIHECTTCKKKFVKNHHLKYHMKIHNRGMNQLGNALEMDRVLELPELVHTEDINILTHFDTNSYQLVEVFDAE